MVFSTILFLFRFLPITLALYYLAPAKLKNTVLFVCSLVFYCWGEVRFFPVMLALILINYLCGLGLERMEDKPAARTTLLLVALAGSLGMLFYFKYANFVLSSLNSLFGTQFAAIQGISTLPLGISFYTFQTLSYTIDVYRRDVKTEHNIIDFGAYVVMFPQLIAGPIVKYRDVSAQLHVYEHRYSLRQIEEGMVNPNLKTGEVEVVVSEWKLLNTSKTPPFQIEDRVEAGENLRLQWRYLDLRRPRMARNLALRSRTAMAIRNELASQGFLEVETPILTKSTPEGARDYLVPSRLNHGQFYALPQSPQQFKQFCMIAGLDRYFQIARCFRDEDLRADRQPEFTQVDIEMSFADEKQVMDMAEGLMIRVFKEALGADIPAPFPRMTWDEAMSRYGVDKPDTRFGLELQDVTSIVSNSGFKLFASAKLVKAMRVPGGENLTRKEIDELTEFVKIYGAQGLAWIKIRENEWQSPIAKFLSDEERAGLTEALGLSVGDIVFFQAGEPGMVNAALGNLRVHLGEKLGLIPEIAPRYRVTYFNHIIGGYAAGYYSYLWANVLDNDAFEAFKEHGIFDKNTADLFRYNVLEKGDSEDPMILYKNFRGAEPSLEPLLKNRGMK